MAYQQFDRNFGAKDGLSLQAVVQISNSYYNFFSEYYEAIPTQEFLKMYGSNFSTKTATQYDTEQRLEKKKTLKKETALHGKDPIFSNIESIYKDFGKTIPCILAEHYLKDETEIQIKSKEDDDKNDIITIDQNNPSSMKIKKRAREDIIGADINIESADVLTKKTKYNDTDKNTKSDIENESEEVACILENNTKPDVSTVLKEIFAITDDDVSKFATSQLNQSSSKPKQSRNR